MQQQVIEELGDELYQALCERTVVEPVTKRHPDVSIDAAYQVSARMLNRRIAAGEKLVGRKVGLTNKAVQGFFGIDHPDFGNLTNAMQFSDGADVPISDLLIQPKVEGEIAIVLKHDLNGPDVSVADVLEAVDYAAPCFEIVDSRIRDWRIKIADTIADNGSSALFVLGEQHEDPRDLDLRDCRMALRADGEIVSEGTGAAALGSPLGCVAWLANALSQYNDGLQAGDIILSGSLGPVIEARPGTAMQLSIGGIGEASLRFS
ncbi:MAG: 2-keto-4-pentenoate hydratase [Woeseiaceae bacterium]